MRVSKGYPRRHLRFVEPRGGVGSTALFLGESSYYSRLSKSRPLFATFQAGDYLRLLRHRRNRAACHLKSGLVRLVISQTLAFALADREHCTFNV